MTDSPRAQLPIDPDERPIEGQLQQIRNQLELLKQDKSCYVKSYDVIKLYKATIEQVKALNELRQRKDKKDEQNRGEFDQFFPVTSCSHTFFLTPSPLCMDYFSSCNQVCDMFSVHVLCL
jgi:hypothetical protein